jgi:uncharacterized repeat protein (TIGR01451 family)
VQTMLRAVGGAVWTRVVLVAALLLLAPATAAAERAYTIRYSANLQGDISGTGNTLLTCLDTDTVCAAARAGTASGAANNNNSRAMRYVDIDGDPRTFDSSAATLALPPGGRVAFAGLYYGGRSLAGTGGQAAPNAAQRGQVLFRPPGLDDYLTLQADTVDNVVDPTGLEREYQGFVDVTDIVRAAGIGEYMVGNVQLGTGLNADQSGGWALAVAYEDTNQPMRNLTIFDGFRFVLADGPAVTIPLAGFITPRAGTVTTRVGLVAIEGDLGTNGDSATLNGRRLFNAFNPENNFFNSSISGRITVAKRPNYVNQLGFDGDVLDASGYLTNNQTSTTVVLATSGDGFAPDGVSFATDLFAPSLRVTKTVDKATARLGEELTYTLSATNTGLDAAVKTSLSDAIPAGTTYVPGSLEILSGANAGPKTDAASDDQATYADGGIVFNLGSGAGPEFEGGRLGIGEETSVRFRVRVNDAGLASGYRVANAADLAFAGETLGTAGSVSSPVATTEIIVPDLAIAKTHTGDFVPGRIVPFSLVVSNAGSAASLGEVTVTDTLPPGLVYVGTPAGTGWACATAGLRLTCTRADSLAVGAQWPPIQFSAAVAAAAPPGTLANTAVVAGGGDGNEVNNSATDFGPLVPGRSDLAIDKAVLSDHAYPGEAIAYRLTVHNIGLDLATDVTVTELFPDDVTPVEISPSRGTCTLSLCRLGSMAPDEEATIDVRVVASPEAARSELRNVATVDSPESDPVPLNDTDDAVVAIDPLVDLAVTKQVAAPSVAAGSDVSYVVAITNKGPNDATDVQVTDLAPPRLTLVGAEPSQGTCAGGRCSLGTLRADGAAQIVVVARSTRELAGTTVENTVVAEAAEDDANRADNVASADVAFTAAPPETADVRVTKRASADSVVVGQTVDYTITVENAGPGTAEGVLVTETPDAAVDVVSVVPSQGTCGSSVPFTCTLGPMAPGGRATIAVRVRALTAGPLRNAVSAVSPQTALAPGPDVADVRVTPVLSLSKRASRRSVYSGESLVYRMRVRNRGRATRRGISVCDRIPGHLQVLDRGGASLRRGVACWRIARLAAGRSRTLRLVVRAGPVRHATRVTNVATLRHAGRVRRARARVRVLPLARCATRPRC